MRQPIKRSAIHKVTALASVVALLSTLTTPAPLGAVSERPGEEYATRIQDVYASRSEGDYERALREIKDMIADFANADDILRELHNELVKTIHQQRNATQDPAKRARLEAEREDQARETLRLYPDIKAGVGYAGVDALYDGLRAEMFGELRIITSPDSCEVMIDETLRGRSPFYEQYFPIGAHTVRVIKSQYEEKEVTVDVEPAGTHTREIALKKIRGYGWWLSWVVIPVAAGVGVILALTLGGSDGQTDEPPLPEPPAPPTN